MKRIAFYGGSFDPVHNGHLTIARALIELFELDEFFLIPAHHAPHKRDKRITSPFCRYAMLSLATNDEPKIKISTVELNAPEKPFTFETQTKLKKEFKNAEIFFVIGADSWTEITTWRKWEKVLTLTNIIVVTRPGYEITLPLITPEIRERIVDLRNKNEQKTNYKEQKIYITDAVNLDISSTDVRKSVCIGNNEWREKVLPEVAKYVEKYELYKSK
jgi:nicotinate-nucleotide adenylyltransferase